MGSSSCSPLNPKFDSESIITMGTKLHSSLELIKLWPHTLWWSRDLYWSQWWPSQVQPKPFLVTFFPVYVIKYILMTKNPAGESMNPFAFGENNDFPISRHHQNDILAIICFVCRILVLSTFYFCLTPFSTLHLKEMKWYFGNVFSLCFWK